jgi:hypothetical protein
MPIQSLNSNDKLKSLADGDNLSATQKKSLLDQYNTNISPISQQLGYLPTYGATTNPSRSAVSVVASAFDTSGNGGRKVVRLTNGWLVSAAYDNTAFYIRFYKSTDNGSTWSQLCTSGNWSAVGGNFSLVAVGTKVYTLVNRSNNSTDFLYFEATTQTNIALTIANNLDSPTAYNGCSLAYSPTDNTLHAAWASKNATYPNSFNIRYAKGTIASDGSVTWGTPVYPDSGPINISGRDCTNPSIVIQNNNPVILFTYTGSLKRLSCYKNASVPNAAVTIIDGGSYDQSNPSATVDGTGAIHVVWHGLDATDTTNNNIRYSKSTDGGVTWSAITKLTSGNTAPQTSASITYDNNNNLYVYWYGVSGGGNRIRSIVYTTSWGSIVDITSNSSGSTTDPSLCDNIRTFTSPLVIWRDNVSPSVKFSGTWTDTPLLSETTSISAVSNKALIDALVTKGVNGKKYASGTITSSSSLQSFTYIDGTTLSSYYVTVTGLTFKPSLIYLVNGTNKRYVIYSEINDGLYPKTVKFVQVFSSTATTTSNYNLKGDVSPASVTSTGFTLPVYNSSESYSWIAFE